MTVLEALAVRDVHKHLGRTAQELAKESVTRPHPKSYAIQVKQQKQAADKFKKSFEASFDLYHARMKHGAELLAREGLLQRIEADTLVKVLESLQQQNFSESMQEAFGIRDEGMLSFHEYGSSLFERQEFESAADIFLVLTFLNPLISSFWASLGMAEEMKQEYDAAALAFLMASEVNEEELSWALRSAECYMKAGKRDQAQRILDILIDEASKSHLHMHVRQQAIQLKQASR